MMNFEIVCDSSADLPQEFVQAHRIGVVPFYISLDSSTYLREGVDISVTDFYQLMLDNASCFPKTSTPTIQDYMDVMEPLVKAGKAVLCICLTQKFSSSLQSALNARTSLMDEYPDAQIRVIDSQLVTALEGLFVKEAVRLRDLGVALDRAAQLLEDIRSSGRIFFTTKDLKYLEHGGRMSKTASVAGSMLNLKPVLCFHDGELEKPEICRGRKKSLKKVIDNFFAYMDKTHLDLSEYLFGTGLGAPTEDYPAFISALEQRFRETGISPREWFKIQIGATIGVHTGPYPMGLGILKKCNI